MLKGTLLRSFLSKQYSIMNISIMYVTVIQYVKCIFIFTNIHGAYNSQFSVISSLSRTAGKQNLILL